MARRHRHPRESGAQRRGEALLVQRVPEGEQQRHGDRLGGRRDRTHQRHDPGHFGLGQRHDRTARPHALRDGGHPLAQERRHGMVPPEIVQIGAVLTPQPEQVLESGGRDQHDIRSASLEQRVGRDRGPMDENLDRFTISPARPQLVHRPE